MNYNNDKRIVMTLDAGGTNFVFSAIQANEEIIEPIKLPSQPKDLDKCLNTIIDGFKQVESKLKEKPVAISFAFPGPADYRKGIIGDLPNLPAFRGGVALGPMLQEIFNMPVFINNDGNLFVYGEAISGLLPYINNLLEEAGSPKRYENLFGITLGTGLGGGFVHNNELLIGDNSCAAEIWILRHKLEKNLNAEEGASIRAVKRNYAKLIGIPFEETPEPKEIYEIAKGLKDGDKEAAKKSFEMMGEVAGDAIANAITILDGLVVIGGGLSGAHEFFMPAIIDELNSTFDQINGGTVPRLEITAFNLEDKKQLNKFLKGDTKTIKVPFSDKTVQYDPLQRIGVGISKLGTEKAVGIGAYAFALNQLDNN